MNHRRRLIAVGIPLILYGTSMMLPVADFSYGDVSFSVVQDGRPTPGYVAFELGMEAIELKGIPWTRLRREVALAWLANPAIWVAVGALALGRRRLAIGAAAVGSVLAMCVLPTWRDHLTDYPGYWVWWASAVAALLTALFVLPKPAAPFAEDFEPLSRPTAPPPTPAVP